MNKTISISKVHYEMLLTVSKKMRMKPEEVVEEMIQVRFNNKK